MAETVGRDPPPEGPTEDRPDSARDQGGVNPEKGERDSLDQGLVNPSGCGGYYECPQNAANEVGPADRFEKLRCANSLQVPALRYRCAREDSYACECY
ncbi:hypothetical protein [Granulicella tundricola]|uniref:hypothetical protein n=1 Tax=Granulicella tundricola TaxID=940615 RepID=UPI0002FA7010|nr:hypothetical protein [Granulicella tundricola]